MRYIHKLYPVFLFILLITLCNCGGGDDSNTPVNTQFSDNIEKVSITQGIWGNVWYWEGNFMPGSPSDSPPGGTITPVVRDVYIYQATTLQDVILSSSANATFFSEINTELIAVAQSDATGFYQATLPVGTYSVFIKENEEYYANLFDLNNTINPVRIKENTTTKLQIDITYAAAF